MCPCRTCGRALIACLHEPLSCCPLCHENGQQHISVAPSDPRA